MMKYLLIMIMFLIGCDAAASKQGKVITVTYYTLCLKDTKGNEYKIKTVSEYDRHMRVSGNSGSSQTAIGLSNAQILVEGNNPDRYTKNVTITDEDGIENTFTGIISIRNLGVTKQETWYYHCDGWGHCWYTTE